jgi:hypothetical protein
MKATRKIEMTSLRIRRNTRVERWLLLSFLPLLLEGGLLLRAHRSVLPIAIGVLFVMVAAMALVLGIRRGPDIFKDARLQSVEPAIKAQLMPGEVVSTALPVFSVPKSVPASLAKIGGYSIFPSAFWLATPHRLLIVRLRRLTGGAAKGSVSVYPLERVAIRGLEGRHVLEVQLGEDTHQVGYTWVWKHEAQCLVDSVSDPAR